jgi:hypothetical protein
MSFIVIPLLRINQKICPSQFQMSIGRWFIENDLGLGGVDDALAYQVHVNEMEPHGSLIGSAHATKTKGISFSLSLGDFMEAVGRVPNDLDKRDLVGFLFGGCFLLGLRSVRVTVLRHNEQRPNTCDSEGANQ